MAEKMTPPKIIRREKFVVDHTETNDYGDLMVTSKLGNEYKVKQKRNQLFAIFQPDIEVVVGFASYMDREYIATATPSQQIISTETPIESEPVKPPSVTREVVGKKPPKYTTDNRDKSFALSYAKDIIVAIIGAGGCGFTLEKMTEKQARGVANATKTIANEFNAWLTDTAKVVGEIQENIEGG